MGQDEQKEAINFAMHAIEKLAWSVLTGDYDIREIEEIYNEAQLLKEDE